MNKISPCVSQYFYHTQHTPQVSVVGERGRVNSKGVVLESGEVVEADVVVCNADLPYAEKVLLPDTVARPFEVRVTSDEGASPIVVVRLSLSRYSRLAGKQDTTNS